MVEDNRHPLKRVRFQPDMRSSGFSPRITLPGWDIRKFEVRPQVGEYETDFGHPEVGQRETYSRIEFGLQIARPRAAYLFRLLLPIAVVLLSCFSVFFLSPAFADARVDVPIAVLLTTVALHLTVSSDLPQVGYIRLIDKVYNFAYLVIFVSLVESIAAIHCREKGEGERAQRLDRWAAIILPPLTLVGMLLVMWIG
jgi:heme/copper-type cytochrome/quinol oxidase subunit 4